MLRFMTPHIYWHPFDRRVKLCCFADLDPCAGTQGKNLSWACASTARYTACVLTCENDVRVCFFCAAGADCRVRGSIRFFFLSLSVSVWPVLSQGRVERTAAAKKAAPGRTRKLRCSAEDSEWPACTCCLAVFVFTALFPNDSSNSLLLFQDGTFLCR